MEDKHTELLTRYLNYCEVERGFTAKTLRGKREALKRFFFWLGVKDFSLESVRIYMSDLLRTVSWKKVSIIAEIKVIKAYITWLYENEYETDNWGTKIKLPRKDEPEFDYTPCLTLKRIIEEGSKPVGKYDRFIKERLEHKTALLFMLSTGLRLSELLGLQRQEVNLEAKEFRIYSKGGKIHTATIPANFIQELSKRKGTGKLFQVNDRLMRTILNRGKKILKINKRIRIHDLRHAFVTDLLKAGMPIQEVSLLARHSDIGITMRYYIHYNVSELGRSLNKFHPLIVGDLPPEEVFNRLEDELKTIVGKDKRFAIDTSRDSKQIGFKVILKEK